MPGIYTNLSPVQVRPSGASAGLLQVDAGKGLYPHYCLLLDLQLLLLRDALDRLGVVRLRILHPAVHVQLEKPGQVAYGYRGRPRLRYTLCLYLRLLRAHRMCGVQVSSHTFVCVCA